jgi:basic membrane protein A
VGEDDPGAGPGGDGDRYPAPIGRGSAGDDRPAAHLGADPYDYGYGEDHHQGDHPPGGSARPTGQVAAVDRPLAASDDRDPLIAPAWRAVALLAVLAVVVTSVWFLLPGGDEPTESAAGTMATGPTGSEPAGPEADGSLEGIRTLLRGMGLHGVTVEMRDGTIYLVGLVPTDVERQALVGAAEALAGDSPVDATGLVTSGTTTTAIDDDRASALQADLDRVVAATPIIFEVGKTELTELHKRILNTVATTIQSYPGIPVTIVGYTDDTGDDSSNRGLSLARAESARAYLEEQGVPGEQLELEPRGEDTSTGSAALANLERRVEFEVPLTPAAPVPDLGALRVAIVAPSARNDLAFTQSMVDAVGAVAAERGNVEVSITDSTFVPEEAAEAIRGYAEDGYDLIIAHGSQFGPSVQQLAQEFPGVAFAWGTASDTFGLSNVYAYEAASEQGGYVIGALASRLSGSGTLGVVGPIEVGDAQRYINGFTAGAEAETPGVGVLVTYTGSFSDLSLASETAASHMSSGADVLTGSAQMVIGAISEAAENGAVWFGTQADQSALAPDHVVASQVYHWEVLLRDIVNDIDTGQPGGRTYTADLANGGLAIEYNEAFPLPEPIRQRGDELVAAIVSGAVTPPAG